MDIHNCYDLSYYEFCLNNGGELIIKFKKSYDCKGAPDEIGLVFLGVKQLKVKGLFTEYVNSVQIIGYKDFEDDDMSWIVPEKLSNPNQSIVFLFDDDAYIKVFCETINLFIK